MDDSVHDYVIVRAGSAGCVLAARLTEDLATRVLLLEAGPPDDAAEIAVPAATPTLWQGPFSWDDATVRQPHAGGRRVAWPRGRTLGGSSSINGMVYIRGNRLDYDTWADTYGCTGWSYADLLPYFCRAEDQQRGGSPFHGTGGPLRVEDLRYVHPLSRAWVAAATAAGLAVNDDFNAAAQDGAGFYQLTQRAGRRWSAANGYLRPAMGRRRRPSSWPAGGATGGGRWLPAAPRPAGSPVPGRTCRRRTSSWGCCRDRPRPRTRARRTGARWRRSCSPSPPGAAAASGCGPPTRGPRR